MNSIDYERDKIFSKLFEKKQKADEEFKKYVLGRTKLIGDKKFKELQEKAKAAAANFYNFLGWKI